MRVGGTHYAYVVFIISEDLFGDFLRLKSPPNFPAIRYVIQPSPMHQLGKYGGCTCFHSSLSNKSKIAHDSWHMNTSYSISAPKVGTDMQVASSSICQGLQLALV